MWFLRADVTVAGNYGHYNRALETPRCLLSGRKLLAGQPEFNLSVVVNAVDLIDILEVIAIGRLKLVFGNRLLARKLPVALIRFVPADIDNPFCLLAYV